MFDRNCKGCDKQLPVDHIGTMCTLCASGLIPARPIPQRMPYALEVRADSALHCPHCVAQLNFRDVSQRFCSRCGGVVALESASYVAADQLRSYAAPPVRRATDGRWPDEAPIR